VISPFGAKEFYMLKNSDHVTDKIENADKYLFLNKRFAKAFEFLKRSDLMSLPLGTYDIIPGECWAMVQEIELLKTSEKQFETHHKYIDIQSPISGEETFGLYTMTESDSTAEFDDEKDYCLFDPSDKTAPRFVTLKPGEFALFFPPIGAHAPGCTTGEKHKIKKVVIKVLAQ
jgi:YhcH/YjgK/YiaL family protein